MADYQDDTEDEDPPKKPKKSSKKKMTMAELKAVLDAEKTDALSAMEASKLSAERETAMSYYMGEMSKDMPTLPDRSKAVSSDVADTIEGLMPSLMEIFASGDEVVKFDPVSAEDEPLAEQESDYVNHVFMQQNDGFMVLYSFIKDALLSKNGIVKVWWEEYEEEEEEMYNNLDDETYAAFVEDKSFEIIDHEERVDEVALAQQQAQQKMMQQMALMAQLMPPPMQPQPGGGPPQPMPGTGGPPSPNSQRPSPPPGPAPPPGFPPMNPGMMPPMGMPPGAPPTQPPFPFPFKPPGT